MRSRCSSLSWRSISVFRATRPKVPTNLSLLFSRCGLYIRDGTDLALRMARSQPARQDEIRTKQDYITRQVARRQDVATSLIEANFATVTAAQEREEEWNTKGLESGLNPIVRPGGHSLARE